MSKKWIRKVLNVKSLHFQSATWVADIGVGVKVNDDGKFTRFWSLCESELFPGSRLIGIKGPIGAKINVFNSGKCICMGRLFRHKRTVYDALVNVSQNI
mgnify:CR=1 FL=1